MLSVWPPACKAPGAKLIAAMDLNKRGFCYWKETWLVTQSLGCHLSWKIICCLLCLENKCIIKGGGTVQSRLRIYLAIFNDILQHFYPLLQVELVSNVHFTFISAVVSCPDILLSAFRHILLDLFFRWTLSNMLLTIEFVLWCFPATIDVKRNIFDLCTDSKDCYLAVIEVKELRINSGLCKCGLSALLFFLFKTFRTDDAGVPTVKFMP